MVKENPSADFITDSVEKRIRCGFELMNSANVRGKFETGTLTDRDISGLSPFKNKMYIIKLTEPEIVNAIKVGAKSLTASESLPVFCRFQG